LRSHFERLDEISRRKTKDQLTTYNHILFVGCLLDGDWEVGDDSFTVPESKYEYHDAAVPGGGLTQKQAMDHYFGPEGPPSATDYSVEPLSPTEFCFQIERNFNKAAVCSDYC
jgi:hypothetical protein